jgi:hypothetical protein
MLSGFHLLVENRYWFLVHFLGRINERELVMRTIMRTYLEILIGNEDCLMKTTKVSIGIKFENWTGFYVLRTA